MTSVTATDIIAPPSPKSDFANPLFAYSAGKTWALKATQEFTKRQNSSFDVINQMPSIVIGPNELVRSSADVPQGIANGRMSDE